MSKQSGFGLLEGLVIVLIIAVVGFGGYYVWSQSQEDEPEQTEVVQQEPQNNEPVVEPVEVEYQPPEGWVMYEGGGISFYYPSDWDKSEINVQSAAVTEVVEGTKFGPYRAKVLFNVEDDVWNRIYSDFGSPDTIILPGEDEYNFKSNDPVFSYPAMYGYVGEGGGSTYIIAVTDGTSSYMIELPMISVELDSAGLSEQLQAIPEIIKTIE